MILLIDNYDSFSYNLYQMLGAINPAIRIVRNDEVTCNDIKMMAPRHIVLSPGPGKPSGAGICEDVVRTFAGQIPLLGVCLGHQAICEVYGATVTYAKDLMHGKASSIQLDVHCPLFKGLPAFVKAGRYHSLAADPATIPEELIVTAQTDKGEVMAVQHRRCHVYGLQFHPESILTPQGNIMLKHFLNIIN